MGNLKSYELIQKISNSLYENAKDDAIILSRLRESQKLIEIAISDDFDFLLGRKIKIQKSTIYYDDETYRQSSTSIVFSASTLDSDDFQVIIECLIDFNKILVKIKNESESNDIIKRIMKAYNIEGVAELKEL